MAALLSRVVRDQGRDDEALALLVAAEDAAAADDIEAQALWRSVRAPILARDGDLAEAESLARSAVELAGASQAPGLQADALCELAKVLRLVGNDEEAHQVAAEASAFYAAKGDIVSAARVALWLGAGD